jgi:hypothetical protein
MSDSNEYVTGYLNALILHYAVTSKDRAAKVAQVRAGLIALATSKDTIAKKVIATGVSKSKVSRDNITGKWLIANPKADAIKVKLCGDQLDKEQMTGAKSLKDLEALMPVVAKAKRAAKTKAAAKPKVAAKPAVVVTTPESRRAEWLTLSRQFANDLHMKLTPTDAEILDTMRAVATEIGAATPKAAKVA